MSDGSAPARPGRRAVLGGLLGAGTLAL